MSVLKHAHFFSALPAAWGPFGPQDEHWPPCIEEGKRGARCDRILIGPGRDCDGKPETHREETLR